jgi:hypothetical protein
MNARRQLDLPQEVSAYEVFFRCRWGDLIKIIHLDSQLLHAQELLSWAYVRCTKDFEDDVKFLLSALVSQKRQLTNDDDNRFLGIGHLQVLHISPYPKLYINHLRISATIHPILQISIAFEYSWNAVRQLQTFYVPESSHSMTTGALYHLVATYSVMKPPPPAGPASGGGLAADLANPKSQI